MNPLCLIALAGALPGIVSAFQSRQDPIPAMMRAMHLLPNRSASWFNPAETGLLTPRTGNGSEPAPLSDWASLGFRGDGNKLTAGREHNLDLAMVKSKMELTGTDANMPLRRSGWKTEDTLKMPLGGSLFVTGKVGMNSDSIEQQQYKLEGTTGFGASLPAGGEIQVRGGRSMTNYDADDLSMIREQAKTFVEFSTRWKLPGDLKLEYTGEAIPAQPAFERDVLKQDLRLAIPLSNSGQIHVGAKYRSPDSSSPTPWIERTKIYFGLLLKR